MPRKCCCTAGGCTNFDPCEPSFHAMTLAQMMAQTPVVEVSGFASTPGPTNADCGFNGVTGAGVMNGSHTLAWLSGSIETDSIPPITRDGCRRAHYRKQITDVDAIGFVGFQFGDQSATLLDCAADPAYCDFSPGYGCWAYVWWRHRIPFATTVGAIHAIWSYDGTSWSLCDSAKCAGVQGDCTGGTIGNLVSVTFP